MLCCFFFVCAIIHCRGSPLDVYHIADTVQSLLYNTYMHKIAVKRYCVFGSPAQGFFRFRLFVDSGGGVLSSDESDVTVVTAVFDSCERPLERDFVRG